MFRNEPGIYELYKADSGALRFKVRYPTGMGFAVFTLTSKDNPKKDVYQFFFGPTYRFIDVQKNGSSVSSKFRLPEPIGTEFQGFWLTWYNDEICLGVDEQETPILCYADSNIAQNNIGYVKFFLKSVRWPVEWEFEESPIILKPPRERKIENGHLQWVHFRADLSDPLPKDALIGGFDNEPLYIARSVVNGSLCPGKYVPSLSCAFFPWGGHAYPAQDISLLTGFNAKWVKTKGNRIPDNAFIAGYSEVRNEPLYIGRAMYGNRLLVGKVHCLYSTCYLPYQDVEVQVHSFDILVLGDKESRGVFANEDENPERRPPRQLVL